MGGTLKIVQRPFRFETDVMIVFRLDEQNRIYHLGIQDDV